jgi:hypothetical protein
MSTLPARTFNNREGDFRNCLRIWAGITGSYPGVTKAEAANDQAENLYELI